MKNNAITIMLCCLLTLGPSAVAQSTTSEGPKVSKQQSIIVIALFFIKTSFRSELICAVYGIRWIGSELLNNRWSRVEPTPSCESKGGRGIRLVVL